MHVPDGFFEPAMAAAGGVVAAGTVAVAVRKVGQDLTDRTVPLAGLCAAFVFAAQMVNFPVAAGTSGHLIGATLTAVLLGPWMAVLCLTVVLTVQLLFADGGLSALGINIVLLGIVPAFTGWWAYQGLRRVLAGPRSVPLAAGIAAGLSVPVAAATFAVLFAVGGAADLSLRALLTAMVGVHAFIGIGEGVVTAGAVAFVLGVRPDLVPGASPVAARPVP